MSGRSIPIALQSRLAEPATTTCRLCKITPVVTEVDVDGNPVVVPGDPFGITSLNRNVIYDDGSGPLTYRAACGYTPFAIQSNADLSVDNSEWEVLMAQYEIEGFEADAINRGVYDDATFIEYLVNYESLSDGHAILQSGTVGEIRIIDGLACFPEARSLSQTLKQKSIIELGSVGCRVVKFGDERCKYDVEAEWTAADVDAVGAEADRTFTISGGGLSAVSAYYSPGVFKFLVGANAGRTYEIESYVVAAGVKTVTLSIPTEEPIQATDSGEIRRDCTRAWSGHNSCETYNNRLNFRGEPFRPVADSASLMIPGAGSSGSATDIQES